MNDTEIGQIYTPQVIADTSFPGQEGGATFGVTQTKANQTYTPAVVPEQVFPAKKVATELISDSLNTRSKKILNSFQFTPSGAIQIGNYTQGVNGDVRISAAGIVGRNSLGDTTFAIDGETGDAVFQGTIQGQSLVAGNVYVGDGNIQIDGVNKRMLFFDSNAVPSIVIGLIS